MIDLNADVGEGTGPPGLDLELVGCVTSVSVACGGHAGDRASMEAICSAAADAEVAIGAHPGYPDRVGFGRRETGMSPLEIEQLVIDQISGLSAVAEQAGSRLGHVKPHGALYHRCWVDHEAAAAAIAGILASAPGAAVFAPPGSELAGAALAGGLEVVFEGFADRVYGAAGRLLPREEGRAMLDMPEAVEQAVSLALGGGPAGGAVESVCIHGDGSDPVALAKAVLAAFEQAGIAVSRYR